MKNTLFLLVALVVVGPAHLMALNQAMTGGNTMNKYQGNMMNQQGTVPTAIGNNPITAGPSAMSLYQLATSPDKAAKMAMVNMLMNSPKAAENLIPLMVLSNTNGGGNNNNNNEMLRTMAIMNALGRNLQGGNAQGMESFLMAMALSGNQEGKSMFPMFSGGQNNGGNSAASAEGGNSQLMDMFMLSRML